MDYISPVFPYTLIRTGHKKKKKLFSGYRVIHHVTVRAAVKSKKKSILIIVREWGVY